MLFDDLDIKQSVTILALIVLLLTFLSVLVLLMCGCLSLYDFCIKDTTIKVEQEPPRQVTGQLHGHHDWDTRPAVQIW